MRRLRRDEQVERNRAELLAAARRVFLERGFHAASLDAIAEAAGFSKGVVYSQFASKADLFLALLEQRIEERARENERVAARPGGEGAVREVLAAGARSVLAEPDWALLVLEFRVHAARDPALNARYARLHARTIERLAAILAHAAGPSGARPETMAAFVLAVGSGLTLESAASGDLPHGELRALAERALGEDARPAGGRVARDETRAGATRRRPVARRRDRGTS